jgi:hypothetical protein
MASLKPDFPKTETRGAITCQKLHGFVAINPASSSGVLGPNRDQTFIVVVLVLQIPLEILHFWWDDYLPHPVTDRTFVGKDSEKIQKLECATFAGECTR